MERVYRRKVTQSIAGRALWFGGVLAVMAGILGVALAGLINWGQACTFLLYTSLGLIAPFSSLFLQTSRVILREDGVTLRNITGSKVEIAFSDIDAIGVGDREGFHVCTLDKLHWLPRAPGKNGGPELYEALTGLPQCRDIHVCEAPVRQDIADREEASQRGRKAMWKGVGMWFFALVVILAGMAITWQGWREGSGSVLLQGVIVTLAMVYVAAAMKPGVRWIDWQGRQICTIRAGGRETAYGFGDILFVEKRASKHKNKMHFHVRVHFGNGEKVELVDDEDFSLAEGLIGAMAETY